MGRFFRYKASLNTAVNSQIRQLTNDDMEAFCPEDLAQEAYCIRFALRERIYACGRNSIEVVATYRLFPITS
jgi:hypothetical protein